MEERAELQELHREWRKEVSETLKELRSQISAVSKQLTDMRQDSVQHIDFEIVKARLTALEQDRAKLIGAGVLLQLIGGFVVWLISKNWH